MNIKVITFATGRYVSSSIELEKHLKTIGIKDFTVFSDTDIPMAFAMKHKEIFQNARGYGYWLWKPYIILQELKKLKAGDVLMYIDSADIPQKKFFDYLKEHMNTNDILLLNRGYRHGSWTKADCFVLMGCNDSNYKDKVQLEAGLLCFRNTRESIELVTEWLKWCTNYQAVSDAPNKCGVANDSGFVDHRHDQSILTNIVLRRGIVSVNLNSDYINYNINQ